tara:strand:- start:3168 stop:6164 length:2997 start_codon:yes stop_codon:yes gene_type:complete
MPFNEDSRVKIPAILHLIKLGFKYLSLKKTTWNEETNIFEDIFIENFIRINDKINKNDADKVLKELSDTLNNNDLGSSFYKTLTDNSNFKVIDFENFSNNQFNVVTELPYKSKGEEFRPDITLIVNGLPLVFIEVKKPNNHQGMIAERERIKIRFKNKNFRKFFNITQLMVFTNNLEYDNDNSEPIKGSFYASPSYHDPKFNFFREEQNLIVPEIEDEIYNTLENEVLKDNNLLEIKNSKEFQTNKNNKTPANRILTSLFSLERLFFILKYGIAYLRFYKNNKLEIQQHILRYPQLFAIYSLLYRFKNDKNNGIIWHTQGSGKTALVYFCIRPLMDFFNFHYSNVPRFYFIVDRIPLLNQAMREFKMRGLHVHLINNRKEYLEDLKVNSSTINPKGEPEITLINIQRFDDASIVKGNKVQSNIQRIYFLDEAHRSYDTKGNFLANLIQSDRNAFKIALSGTPLIGLKKSTKKIFGPYIHKYFYDKSILDGYTLRLIREDIESNYREALEDVIKNFQIPKGEIPKKNIFSHSTFVEPLTDYILKDFSSFKIIKNDSSVGAMIVCDSSDQAKELFKIFNKKNEVNQTYGIESAALILHDVGTKEDRDKKEQDFKDGKIDILIVYNMLLTGFDAPRLKKLYLCRLIKKHNLLQALTRVNRPYKDHKYGYVVDFADITDEFKKTNSDYLNELQEELGDEFDKTDIFLSENEIQESLSEIDEIIYEYDLDNLENFTNQISGINKKDLQTLVKVLKNSKDLKNQILSSSNSNLVEKFSGVDFKFLNSLYIIAKSRFDIISFTDSSENSDTINLLNVVLNDFSFSFDKVGEYELILTDKFRSAFENVRLSLIDNFDKNDPEWITLKDEFDNIFKEKNINEMDQEHISLKIDSLNNLFKKSNELNSKNNILKFKYNGDEKYAKTHKRLKSEGKMSTKNLVDTLTLIKNGIDDLIINNSKILNNRNYFEIESKRIISLLNKNWEISDVEYIADFIFKEYYNYDNLED